VASLQVGNEKKFLVSFFFVSDVQSGVGFWPFWMRLPGRQPNR